MQGLNVCVCVPWDDEFNQNPNLQFDKFIILSFFHRFVVLNVLCLRDMV